MDITALIVLSGLASTVIQMAATIIVLFCVVSFFSYKPGGSTRFFYISLAYFFLSYAVLFTSAVMLENVIMSVPSFSGVSPLLMASLINLAYGVLILALYIRTVVFE